MEKSIKRLRADNIRLIEEYNALTNEHKKLRGLRKLIKEAVKELLGSEYNEDMVNSSEDEKKTMKRSKSTG